MRYPPRRGGSPRFLGLRGTEESHHAEAIAALEGAAETFGAASKEAAQDACGIARDQLLRGSQFAGIARCHIEGTERRDERLEAKLAASDSQRERTLQEVGACFARLTAKGAPPGWDPERAGRIEF
mgnify:CR=1 FL=1